MSWAILNTKDTSVSPAWALTQNIKGNCFQIFFNHKNSLFKFSLTDKPDINTKDKPLLTPDEAPLNLKATEMTEQDQELGTQELSSHI